MKDKKKMSAAPPKKELDDFLARANEPPARSQAPKPPRAAAKAKAEAKPPPWEEPGIEREGLKVFNLRLQPRHFYMLKYLAENTRRASMQSIALDILEPALEEAVRGLPESKE